MEDKIHTELVKLEEELSTLKNSVEYIESAKISVEAASSVLDSAEKIHEEFKILWNYTAKLIKKIDNVDFPSRLDKLDSTVSSINQNISNLQARIESTERNLKEGISNQKIELERSSKELKRGISLNRVWTIINMILIILLGVLFYIK